MLKLLTSILPDVEPFQPFFRSSAARAAKDLSQQALAEKDLSYGNTPTAPGPQGMASLDQIDKLPFANSDPEFNKPFFDYIEKTFKNPNAQ